MGKAKGVQLHFVGVLQTCERKKMKHVQHWIPRSNQALADSVLFSAYSGAFIEYPASSSPLANRCSLHLAVSMVI